MKPFKKVFVAVDHSQASRHAVDYAARLALRKNASLAFCHAIDLANHAQRHVAFDAADNLARLRALRRDSRALLADAQALADGRAVPARALELVGSTAAATANAAFRRDASAVVVGYEFAHRRTTHPDQTLGDDVLRLSDRPVILVSRPITTDACATSIVVAIDGSAAAREALDFALDFAAGGRAHVVAVHVLPKHVSDESVSRRKALLEDVTAYAARRGSTIDAAFARGHVVDEISDVVKALKADLVVLGSDGPGALCALPVPSLAKRVAREIAVPVAVVRATQPSHVRSGRISLAIAS